MTRARTVADAAPDWAALAAVAPLEQFRLLCEAAGFIGTLDPERAAYRAWLARWLHADVKTNGGTIREVAEYAGITPPRLTALAGDPLADRCTRTAPLGTESESA